MNETACSSLDILSDNATKMPRRKQKIVVVGAGPVGTLAALYAAGRGDDVEVYEFREGNKAFNLHAIERYHTEHVFIGKNGSATPES